MLVYYKPADVTHNETTLALVRGTSTVEEIREAVRSTSIGLEATYIDNQTAKDAKIKDITQKIFLNRIKTKESCGEIENAVPTKKRKSAKMSKEKNAKEAK